MPVDGGARYTEDSSDLGDGVVAAVVELLGDGGLLD